MTLKNSKSTQINKPYPSEVTHYQDKRLMKLKSYRGDGKQQYLYNNHLATVILREVVEVCVVVETNIVAKSTESQNPSIR